MESLFFNAIDFSPILLYTIAFFGLILEANTLLFAIAFLTEHGIFRLQYIFPLVIFSSIIGSLFWYYIGYLSLTRPNIFSKIMHLVSEPIDQHLKKYTLQTLFLTKFIYGLNCATIVRSGQIKIPIMRFLKYEIISCIAWTIIVGSMGYASGDAYKIAGQYFKYTEIGLLFAIIFFIILKKIISKYAEKEIKS